MGWNCRMVLAGAAFASCCGFLAGRASAAEDDTKPPAPVVPPKDAATPAQATPKAPAPLPEPTKDKPAPGSPVQPEKPAPPPAPTSAADLHAAIDNFVGAPVHGSLSVRYLARWTADETDQDAIQILNVGIGDETRDRISGNFSVRAVVDLDGNRSTENGQNVFYSLNDTFDKSVNAYLYTAYATIRQTGGAVEYVRIARQYADYAASFHFDGATATTQPLVDSIKLRLTAYAGVPVHFYESSSSSDWLVGLHAAADPWKGGRAAVDYAHDQDELSYLGTGQAKNDLAALSVWQSVMKHVDVYGQFTWLDGPRDATARATYSLPDADFLVQASYYQLIRSKEQMATEFDSYYAVIGELDRYQQVDVHASKGLGENFDVDAGVNARHLMPNESQGAFNRDTTRLYVTPTMSDIPWKGFSLSVTSDSYSGGGEDLQTWAVDATYKLTKTTKVSVGSDYSLYAFGALDNAERTHVRTAYARLRTALTKSIGADVQYTWEKDDVETFQILSLALVLDF